MKKVHWYYKFLIVFIIFFSMFFLFNENISEFINKSTYKNNISHLNKPIIFIKKYNIFKYKELLEKNKDLEYKILTLSIRESEEEALKEDIKILKEAMKLTNTYSDYDLIYATTTTRNKMYWYSTITINKGSKDNIEEGSAVVSSNGLIGTVKSTTKDYSTVKLISNNDKENKTSVMVKVKNNTKIGLIEGYNYPYLKVSLTTDEKNINIGDTITTSGLGNLPKGIYIGTIKKIEKDNYNLGTILYVEPKEDMNDINYVAVLNSK